MKGSSFKPPFPDNEEKIFTLIDRRSYNTFQKRTETNDLDNFDARLKYFSKEFLMIPTTPKTEERVHNHFIHNNFLGNKKALFYNLKYYYDLRGKNLWDIIPLTFHIKNSENDNQYQALMAATVKVEQGKGSKTKNVWIVKPG